MSATELIQEIERLTTIVGNLQHTRIQDGLTIVNLNIEIGRLKYAARKVEMKYEPFVYDEPQTLTIRDRVAIAAMQSLMRGPMGSDHIPERAYEYADRMLVERSKSKS